MVVAYADAAKAGVPPVEEVAAFAREKPGRVLLIDTFAKGPPRRTLLDWMSVRQVTALCQRCREAGVRVALAGSLGEAEIVTPDAGRAGLVRRARGRLRRGAAHRHGQRPPGASIEGVVGRTRTTRAARPARPPVPKVDGEYLGFLLRHGEIRIDPRTARFVGVDPFGDVHGFEQHQPRAPITVATRAATESLVTSQECGSEPGRPSS